MSNRTIPGTYISGDPWFPYGAPPKMTKEEQLERDLKIALQRLSVMTAIPGIFASVIEVEEDYVTICTGPQTLSLKRPMAMEGLEVGAVVRLQQATDQPPAITRVVETPPATGPLLVVKQVVDDTYVECAPDGGPPQKIMVLYQKEKMTLRPDDRVILDLTGKVIVRNIGRGDKSKVFAEDTGVTWDDVGGLEEAKKLLIEAIEEPILHKDLYTRYGKRPTRGILLYGPPGTGKTLLGKAAASALARVHGSSARSGGFMYVKGPEILNMFVGNSEQNIRQIFAGAREHARTQGYPPIVFIDEADAILGKRGQKRGIEGMERTLVPQFLAEMDGLEDAGAMVLFATNRPDTLDPAVVRPGRVDVKIYVRRPTQDEAKQIFALYVKKMPLAEGTSQEELAVAGATALFDDKNALIMLRCKDGKDQRFGMRDLASGALIAAAANNAAQRALRRERDGQTPQGVTTQDFVDVMRDLVKEYRSLDHGEALQDFVENRKLEVTGVEVVRA